MSAANRELSEFECHIATFIAQGLSGPEVAREMHKLAARSTLEGTEALSVRSYLRIAAGEQRPKIKALADEMREDLKGRFANRLLAAKVHAIVTLRDILRNGSEKGKTDAAHQLATDFGTISPEEHQSQGLTMADAVLLLHDRDANASHKRVNGNGSRQGAGNGSGGNGDNDD